MKNLKIFLRNINNNKEKLISIENFKPLSTNNLEKKMGPKDISEIIPLVKEIVEYSIENNKLLINFIGNFWEKLINVINSSSEENIMLLYELREIFIKYFELVTNLFNKGPIFNNAKDFDKKDKFDITLHNNIKEDLKKEKNI